MRRLLGWGFCLVALAGCPSGPESTQPSSDEAVFAGKQVDVVLPSSPDFSTASQILFDEWTAQTGGQYQIRTYDAYQQGQPLVASLSAEPSQSAGADAQVVLFPITAIAELSAASLLLEMPRAQQSVGSLDWADLFQGLRENVASVSKTPTVIPVSSPVLVCYYRRDLLEIAGLAPPKTWQEYQQLLDTLPEWAPGLSALEPWNESFRATMFLARAMASAKHPGNYSLFFDVGSGEPTIDSPGFVRALEASQKALAKMSLDVLKYGPADCRREFFAGRAALAIAFETGPGNPPLMFGPTAANVNDSAQADTAEETEDRNPAEGRPANMAAGFCRLPGSNEVYNLSAGAWEAVPDGVNQTTLTAFAGLCAGVLTSEGEDDQSAAWNLLEVLVSSENIPSIFQEGTKSPCRAQQSSTPELWVGTELDSGEMMSYWDAVSESLEDNRLVAELPVVGHHAFRKALTEELGALIANSNDDASAEKTLTRVAERWRKIAAKLGAEKVQNSYRRSLGLRDAIRAR